MFNSVKRLWPLAAATAAIMLTGPVFASEGAGEGGGDKGLQGGLTVDRLEMQHSAVDQTNYHYWHADGWLGTETDRVYLKSEGAHAHGFVSGSLSQLLYGHALTESWMLEAGVARTGGPGPGLDWLALTAEGDLPYSVDSEWTLFLRNDNKWLRGQFERITPLSGAWKFVPKLEVNFYSNSASANQIGSGLSSAELSLRLAYDLSRQVAGYVGYSRLQNFGNTAAQLRSSGISAYDNLLIAGLMISL